MLRWMTGVARKECIHEKLEVSLVKMSKGIEDGFNIRGMKAHECCRGGGKNF